MLSTDFIIEFFFEVSNVHVLNIEIDKIFTVDLTFTTYHQINGKDFINFCGLLEL